MSWNAEYVADLEAERDRLSEVIRDERAQHQPMRVSKHHETCAACGDEEEGWWPHWPCPTRRRLDAALEEPDE